MRALFLLAAAVAIAPAAVPTRPAIEAVEFPYYAYPRQFWERELVWLKTIGVRTVAFSIPWNWHEPYPGEFDFTGRTSPRRDLMGLVRLLRRLGLEAWIRPLPPVRNWSGGGYPPGVPQERRAARGWLRELERQLATQTVAHGGPLAWAEGAGGFLDLPSPPTPVTFLPIGEPGAFARARQALESGRGSLLWQEVEDEVRPAGWEASGADLIHHGAVELDGEERPTAAALRRDSALLRNWEGLLAQMRPQGKARVRPATGKFPAGVSASELVSRAASSVTVINRAATPFRGDLRAYDPVARRSFVIPNVQVPAGQALWLPVSVSLAGGGLCHDCAGLAVPERILYSTAELETVEFENGILAMEFAAPVAGEVAIQFARRPSGPLLAAGHPTDYDFDEKTLRARLPVPAGQGAGYRVRIGLALEPPESSAFFGDTRRLIIGRRNVLPTSYSSAQLRARSRLKLPEGFTATPAVKSPLELDYDVDVPAEALHGDWANFAIEADGVLLGRARLQLFRPVSVRLAEAVALHYGQEGLPIEPLLVPIDPRAGRDLDFSILNNTPEIQTYHVEARGEGLQFFPPKTDISIGGTLERSVRMRVFAEEGGSGPREFRLRITGGAEIEIPVRVVPIPRGRTVVYPADLDGDGYPEWVLESQRARAVFSSQDGGRWLEFVWKDSDLNLLPETGALAGVGPVVARVKDGSRLEMVTSAGTRTLTLDGAVLTVEQSTPLEGAVLPSGKRNEVTFEGKRESPTRFVYSAIPSRDQRER